MSPEQVLKAQTFFLLNWDFHRFFYLSGFKKLLSDFPSFWNWALSIGLTPIFLAGFFTASLLASRTKTGLTPPQLDLLTVILVMFLGGWTLVTIHQQLMHEPAFLEKYPVFLWILKSMPNRLLNLVSFAMFPLVIGILFARRGQLVPALLLIGILACPIFLKDVHSRWDLRKVSYILCVIAVPAVCLTHMKIRPIYCTLLLCLISIVLTNRTMISPFSFLRQHHRHEYQLYPDLASIPSSGKFMITGPGLSWAQYFTRRPQLVSPGQLDYLSYAQGGWTEVIDVLKDIYGVDYYAHVAHHGSIVQYPPNQIAFENKTREDWYRLGEKYNADLLTVEYRYKIDLPPLYIKPNYFIVYSLVRPVSDQFKL